MRHWVSTISRKTGLSPKARDLMQGWDNPEAMRDWYDNPEQVLDDQDEAFHGKGPLGCLHPPEVRVVGGLPQEVVALNQAYLAGEIGTMEFSMKMEALRIKVPKVHLVG